jgi:hypothetical protein
MFDVLRRGIKALVAKESQLQDAWLRLSLFLREVSRDARRGLLELRKDGGSGCCSGGCPLLAWNVCRGGL